MTHMSRHTLIRLQILPLQSKHSHRWKSHQSEKLKGESSHFSLWCMLYRVIDDVPLDSSIIAPIPDKARFFTYSKWDGQQWQGTGNWLFFGEKKNLWRRQDIISWLSVKKCLKAEIEFSFVVNQPYFNDNSLFENLTVGKKQGVIFEKHQAKQSLLFY